VLVLHGLQDRLQPNGEEERAQGVALLLAGDGEQRAGLGSAADVHFRRVDVELRRERQQRRKLLSHHLEKGDARLAIERIGRIDLEEHVVRVAAHVVAGGVGDGGAAAAGVDAPLERPQECGGLRA
jgi:hypothetical protein